MTGALHAVHWCKGLGESNLLSPPLLSLPSCPLPSSNTWEALTAVAAEAAVPGDEGHTRAMVGVPGDEAG